ISPSAISSETSTTAGTPPKRLLSPSMRRRGALGMGALFLPANFEARSDQALEAAPNAAGRQKCRGNDSNAEIKLPMLGQFRGPIDEKGEKGHPDCGPKQCTDPSQHGHDQNLG